MNVEERSTPTFEQALRKAVLSVLSELSVTMPGVVIGYNSRTRTAEVQPAIKIRRADGTYVQRSNVTGVPVLFPTADNGLAGLTLPVSKGDPCLLIVSQRCIDSWKKTGVISDPQKTGMFDVSDAVAIPGISPEAKAVPADSDSVTLRYATARMRLKKNGEVTVEATKIAIGNQAVELLKLVSDVIGVLGDVAFAGGTAVHLFPTGVADPATVAKAAELKVKAVALQQQLQAITGKL